MGIKKVWWGYIRECGTQDCEGCEYCNNVEPPAGKGFQLWETVSEGSPLSPVFKTREELCEWLANTLRKHDITNGLNYDDWMKATMSNYPCIDIETGKLVEDSK